MEGLRTLRSWSGPAVWLEWQERRTAWRSWCCGSADLSAGHRQQHSLPESFGFLVRGLSSQHPSCVKRAPVGRRALQMDPSVSPLPLAQLPDELAHSCLSDSPPKYRLAHQAAVSQPDWCHQSGRFHSVTPNPLPPSSS